MCNDMERLQTQGQRSTGAARDHESGTGMGPFLQCRCSARRFRPSIKPECGPFECRRFLYTTTIRGSDDSCNPCVHRRTTSDSDFSYDNTIHKHYPVELCRPSVNTVNTRGGAKYEDLAHLDLAFQYQQLLLPAASPAQYVGRGLESVSRPRGIVHSGRWNASSISHSVLGARASRQQYSATDSFVIPEHSAAFNLLKHQSDSCRLGYRSAAEYPSPDRDTPWTSFYYHYIRIQSRSRSEQSGSHVHHSRVLTGIRRISHSQRPGFNDPDKHWQRRHRNRQSDTHYGPRNCHIWDYSFGCIIWRRRRRYYNLGESFNPHLSLGCHK